MYIRKRGSLPEDEAKYISYQLMKGLFYLHNLHIAHRGTLFAPPFRTNPAQIIPSDLKVMHLLRPLQSSPHLYTAREHPTAQSWKLPSHYHRRSFCVMIIVFLQRFSLLADFGLARPRAFEETFRVAGTISYLPPEAITALNCKHIGYVGQPSDCWALGVCIYIMLECVHCCCELTTLMKLGTLQRNSSIRLRDRIILRIKCVACKRPQ